MTAPLLGPGRLRTPAPTLEPDDAFLARLGALAASGAPQGTPVTPPSRSNAPAILAAACVALLAIGIAWLSGLGDSGAPRPAPAIPITPAASPTAPPAPGHADSPHRRATSPRTDGTAFGAAPEAPASVPPSSGRTDASTAAQDRGDHTRPRHPWPGGRGHRGHHQDQGRHGGRGSQDDQQKHDGQHDSGHQSGGQDDRGQDDSGQDGGQQGRGQDGRARS